MSRNPEAFGLRSMRVKETANRGCSLRKGAQGSVWNYKITSKVKQSIYTQKSSWNRLAKGGYKKERKRNGETKKMRERESKIQREREREEV